MTEKDKKSSASFVPFRPLDSLFEPTVQEQPTPAKNGLTDLELVFVAFFSFRKKRKLKKGSIFRSESKTPSLCFWRRMFNSSYSKRPAPGTGRRS